MLISAPHFIDAFTSGSAYQRTLKFMLRAVDNYPVHADKADLIDVGSSLRSSSNLPVSKLPENFMTSPAEILSGQNLLTGACNMRI